MFSNDDPYRQNPSGRDAKFAGYAPLVRQKPPKLSRNDRKQLLDELSSHAILGGCDRDDLAALIKESEPCSLPAGWAMIAEGTPADFCYAILKGSAGIYRGDQLIAEIGPGALVGEMAVLTGELRSATVTTLTRVSALGVPNAKLIPMLRSRPSLAKALRHQFEERATAAGRHRSAQ
jgi:CRP-like cAMP-binding protein